MGEFNQRQGLGLSRTHDFNLRTVLDEFNLEVIGFNVAFERKVKGDRHVPTVEVNILSRELDSLVVVVFQGRRVHFDRSSIHSDVHAEVLEQVLNGGASIEHLRDIRDVEVKIDLTLGNFFGVDAEGIELVLELVHEALELFSIDGHAHVSEHLFEFVQQVVFPVVSHRPTPLLNHRLCSGEGATSYKSNQIG